MAATTPSAGSGQDLHVRRVAFEVLNAVSTALLVTALLLALMVPVGWWLSGLEATDRTWPLWPVLLVFPTVGAALSLSFGAARVYPPILRPGSSA